MQQKIKGRQEGICEGREKKGPGRAVGNGRGRTRGCVSAGPRAAGCAAQRPESRGQVQEAPVARCPPPAVRVQAMAAGRGAVPDGHPCVQGTAAAPVPAPF